MEPSGAFKSDPSHEDRSFDFSVAVRKFLDMMDMCAMVKELWEKCLKASR